MGWLASLFASFDSSQRARKGQALSSTHEAFSLPTSSPVFGTHPDAFNPDALHTPDVNSATSPSYTYPPQGKGSYGYIPSALNSCQGSSSLLPTHLDSLHTPLSPHGLYTPVTKTWDRLRSWLSRHYPELGDTLNYGILPQDLAQIEIQFGFALPAAVRESYLCVDGQEAESAAGCSEGLFFGLTFLPLENVLEEWRFWREVDEDSTTGANPSLLKVMQSIPPGWIRKEYSQRGWIPLIADKAGNYVGVDLNPAEQGSVGQVIIFGRDFDTKVVLWNGDGPGGWAKWLASFVEELESGEGFEIGINDNSEGSEDGVGYESYYHDGHGHGAGDGGGDSGSGGGLRLTGEYRGWNTLEAWGDRSLRKWHEAGFIPNTLLQQEEDEDIKGKNAVGLGVVNLTDVSGVEVPLHDVSGDEPIQTSDSQTSTEHTSRTHPPNVPIISVTKPPAPRPVGLPTPQDIAATSFPSDSLHSAADDDLEAGRGHGMREFQEDIGLVTSTRKSVRQHSPLRRDTSETVGSAIPLSPPPSLPPSASFSDTIQGNQRTIFGSVIPDLLADSTPSLDTVPIQPSSLPTLQSESAKRLKIDPLHPVNSENVDVEDDVPSSATTIRLIGGGGTTGVAESAVEPTSEIPEGSELYGDSTRESDVASISDSITPEADMKKAHKNKSNLAGFKKFGQLGRRKDSSASAKDVSPTVTK